jgi:hypothetical protein
MSELGEGERSREHTANEPRVEQSKQRGTPKGIPFTFLPESQARNTEGRKGEAYLSEVYLRVIDNLQQMLQEAIHRQETSEQERGVENTLLMVNLGLQAIAYDHLGPKGQADFKDELFSLIKSQDWDRAIQPVSDTMRLWKNNFELTVTQGKILQRIAEGLNLTYDPGGEYDIAKRSFNYEALLQRPITKHPDDPVEYKPHYDSEIKAYLHKQTKNKPSVPSRE